MCLVNQQMFTVGCCLSINERVVDMYLTELHAPSLFLIDKEIAKNSRSQAVYLCFFHILQFDKCSYLPPTPSGLELGSALSSRT